MKVQGTAVSSRKTSRLMAGVLLGSVLVSACSGDSAFSPAQKLGSSGIQLTQSQVQFNELGESASLQVSGAGAGAVSWSTADPSVAEVDAAGVVRAVSAGTTFIVARVGSWKDSVQVTVNQQATQLVVSPQVDTLFALGATARLTAKAYDRKGNPAKVSVAWTSLNPAVATVGNDGVVTAVQLGAAQVVAMAGLLADTATTLVLQGVQRISLNPNSAAMYVGQTVAFSAVAVDSKGNVISSMPITWTSSNPSVAAVVNGMVTGIAVGSASITASAGGKSASSNVQVSKIPVAAVNVSPSSASAQVGGAVQLTAQTLDASGNILTNRTVTWASSNAGVATVSAAGLVTAVGAGQATITASSEGVQGQSAFSAISGSATPAPTTSVATVLVSPSSLNIGAGTSYQFSATTLDGSGNTLTGRAVTWSSSAPSIASISSNGLVTALTAGQTTIVATSEGKTGQATITVSAAAVASITISPATGSITAGTSLQLAATAKDAQGNVLTGRTFTWRSLTSTIATVSATGLVTGVAAGTATIEASCDGVAAQAVYTIASAPAVPAPVASITLSPASTALQTNQTAQLVATLKDANGNVLTGRSVTWASSAPATASVSSSGVVMGVAAGSATVTATAEGVNGNASVAVSTATGFNITSDFESGALSPFRNPWGSDIDVIADPTAAGHGKVVRIHYTQAHANLALVPLSSPTLGPGQTMWFKGDVYIPTPTGPSATEPQRKLIYFLPMQAGMCLTLWGTTNPTLKFENTGTNIAPLPFDTWHTIRFRMQLNSAANVADGEMEIWVDGTHQLVTGVTYITSSTALMNYFGVGYQVNYVAPTGTIWSEDRYWDNVTFSSGTIQ